MICQKCQSEFPSSVMIGGHRKYLHTRKFCLECSPPDRKNTKDITKYPRPREISGVLHKTCRGCKRELPFIPEYFYTTSTWGISRALCKECSRKNKNERNFKLKKWAIDYKGGKCCQCGYDKYYGALDFHHLDPTKKDFTVSGKKKQSALKSELDKCILVCSNCHREIHGNVTIPNV